MNRDELYREAVRQVGAIEVRKGSRVERIKGGAWVTCRVHVHNFEINELLNIERRERARTTELYAEVDELAERITEGRIESC